MNSNYLYLLVLGLCIWAPAAFSQSLEEEIISAVRLIGIGQNDQAIAKYDSLITEYPSVPTLHLLKGEAWSNINGQYTKDSVQYANAVACFKKAIEIDSSYFDAYRSMGLLNIYHQEFKKASIDFSYCIRYAVTDKDKFNSYSDRGAAYLYLGKFEQAEFDYYEALRLKPNAPGVYANLAMMHLDKGDFEFARNLCEKGLEFAPKDVALLNNIAFISLQEKKFSEAEMMFTKILMNTHDDPLALSNRGFARLKLKKYEHAKLDLDKSIAIYPTNSYAFKNRALLYIAQKDLAQGCADLREAQRLGYAQMHGEEVDLLLAEHCSKN